MSYTICDTVLSWKSTYSTFNAIKVEILTNSRNRFNNMSCEWDSYSWTANNRYYLLPLNSKIVSISNKKMAKKNPQKRANFRFSKVLREEEKMIRKLPVHCVLLQGLKGGETDLWLSFCIIAISCDSIYIASVGLFISWAAQKQFQIRLRRVLRVFFVNIA